MATKKPKGLAPSITASTAVSWNADFEEEKLKVRFHQDIDLMHSCTETNTYILGPDVLDDDGSVIGLGVVDLLWDIQQMNGEALPFGQVVFLSYHSNGEFMIESATDRWSPKKIALAFKSFGFSDIKIIGYYVSVSEKDEFKLKLKFGY